MSAGARKPLINVATFEVSRIEGEHNAAIKKRHHGLDASECNRLQVGGMHTLAMNAARNLASSYTHRHHPVQATCLCEDNIHLP